MASSAHFDDLLAIADVWHQLPSALTLRYMPELRTRHHVTPADLFMLDVAATVRWAQLQRERDVSPQQGQQGAAPPTAAAQGGTAEPSRAAAQEHGDRLAIQGTEIPPWDPRYRSRGPS